MSNRHFPKVGAGNSGLNFTGERRPVSQMSDSLRKLIRNWADNNGLFMSEDNTYIVWKDTIQGKTKLVKLFLTYHKSEVHQKVFIFARNDKHDIRLNLSYAMSAEAHLNSLNFDAACIRTMTIGNRKPKIEE